MKPSLHRQVSAAINGSLLIAAAAYFFFLDEKETKNQDSANASFAAQAFAHISQNHGHKNLSLHLLLNASDKFASPLPLHRHHCFA